MQANTFTRRPRRAVKVTGVAAAAAAVAISALTPFTRSASAEAISSFSGNTQPSKNNSDSSSASGTINFAVFDRNGGVSGDAFGTGVAGIDSLLSGGSASLDTSASYLYLYQTVNNGNTGSGIFQTSIGVPSTFVTSFGAFNGTTFSSSVLGTPAGFADTSPASVGASPVGLLSGQSGLTSLDLINAGSSALGAYTLSDIPVGGKSVVYGYTSNAAPTIGNAAMIEATGSNGRVALAPEPATLSLVGLAGLTLCSRRRRRRHD